MLIYERKSARASKGGREREAKWMTSCTWQAHAEVTSTGFVCV